MADKVVVILGATNTHKSEVALYLASKYPLEIISADSMQFYRGMDIGTAKVPEEIRLRIPHHMIDIIDISQEYSVARYKNEVSNIIKEILGRGFIPVIVGGSGLYIRAITENFPLEENVEPDDKIRGELNNLPIDKLREIAKAINPESSKRIGANDRKRLVRVVEYFKKTGKTIGSYTNLEPDFEF
ncbi:MAG: tRNA (adenosine(37)-N6)-dimethylallyltransferase MiaA, partial [Caldisericaceae bacterium]